jgi:3-methylcrotonyl-CoA carboxylase alpha subunit
VAPPHGLASVTTVTRIGDGVFRVEIDGRAEVVYVAGAPGNRWAFWNGQVFRGSQTDTSPSTPSRARRDARQELSAPMPATVLKVLVAPGATVKKGETLVILEAMKMELPLRASADATVKAVRCREGDLVQPDAVLVELA